MDFHPYADIFPMMTPEDQISLADDIKANGLILPILIDDQDRIVDGRNRFAACKMVGVEPVFEPFVGDDQSILSKVVSLNLARRHLSESQRGMIAAKLANMKVGDNQHDKSAGSAHVRDHIDSKCQSVGIREAAERLNVGTRTVTSCRKVQRNGVPELVKAVESGEIRAKPAEKIASLPKPEQPAAIQNHLNRVVAPVPVTVPQAEESEVPPDPFKQMIQRRLQEENPLQVANDAMELLRGISRHHPLRDSAWMAVRRFIDANLNHGA